MSPAWETAGVETGGLLGREGDCSSDRNGAGGGSGKWSCVGDILKMEPTAPAEQLDMGFEGNAGIKRGS